MSALFNLKKQNVTTIKRQSQNTDTLPIHLSPFPYRRERASSCPLFFFSPSPEGSSICNETDDEPSCLKTSPCSSSSSLFFSSFLQSEHPPISTRQDRKTPITPALSAPAGDLSLPHLLSSFCFPQSSPVARHGHIGELVFPLSEKSADVTAASSLFGLVLLLLQRQLALFFRGSVATMAKQVPGWRRSEPEMDVRQ